MSRELSHSVKGFAKIVAALYKANRQRKPLSLEQLAELSGFHQNTVRKFLVVLHEEHTARISDFGPTSDGKSNTVPLWMFGLGPHAKRQKAEPKPREHRNTLARQRYSRRNDSRARASVTRLAQALAAPLTGCGE